jgi:hypothetical protein
MLYEYSEVKEIYKDRRWSDQNMREEGRINLPKISGQQSILFMLVLDTSSSCPAGPYLGDELTLLELSVDECNISVLVKLGATKSWLVGSLEDKSGRGSVEKTCQRWKLLAFGHILALPPSPPSRNSCGGEFTSR